MNNPFQAAFGGPPAVSKTSGTVHSGHANKAKDDARSRGGLDEFLAKHALPRIGDSNREVRLQWNSTEIVGIGRIGVPPRYRIRGGQWMSFEQLRTYLKGL